MLKHDIFSNTMAAKLNNPSKRIAELERKRALLASEIEPCIRAFISLPYHKVEARMEALKPLSLGLLFELHRIFRRGNRDLSFVYCDLFDEDMERYVYKTVISREFLTIDYLYDCCVKTYHNELESLEWFLNAEHDSIFETLEWLSQVEHYAEVLAFLSVFEKLA